MRSQEYRRAIADCLVSAASTGIIERYYRVGRGSHKVTQDATQLSVSLYLVDCMVNSDFTDRLWMAVDPLQDELGLCITELRKMLHVERTIALSVERLVDLQRRVKVEETAQVIGDFL